MPERADSVAHTKAVHTQRTAARQQEKVASTSQPAVGKSSNTEGPQSSAPTSASGNGIYASAGTAWSNAAMRSTSIARPLDGLATRTNDSLNFLEQVSSEDEATRERIVERVAGDIEFTSDYVRGLISDLPHEDRERLIVVANRAATEIGRVLRWVRTRPAHRRLEETLLRGISAFDEVMGGLGTRSVGERDEVPLSENQRHSAEIEQADHQNAVEQTLIALEQLTSAMKRKITLFEGLALLDDIREPDFKEKLLEALIEETITLMLGAFAKALIPHPTVRLGGTIATHFPVDATAATAAASATAIGQHFAPVSLEQALDVGFGSVKSAVAAKLAAVKRPDPSKPAAPDHVNIDPRKRAVHFFCEGLRGAEEGRSAAYQSSLRTLDAQSGVSITQLRDMTSSVKSMTTTVVDHQMEIITNSWARFLAQGRLGTTFVGNEKVSNMANYFGKPTKGDGREFGSSHGGGDGVLSVLMTIENGKPKIDSSATKIIGINSQLLSYVLDSAHHEFDRVRLPKEVHVEARFARATIAFDELSRIRDVEGWREVQPYVGGITAASFWHTWGRNLRLNQ